MRVPILLCLSEGTHNAVFVCLRVPILFVIVFLRVPILLCLSKGNHTAVFVYLSILLLLCLSI